MGSGIYRYVQLYSLNHLMLQATRVASPLSRSTPVCSGRHLSVLGGSGDLVSKVISTSSGFISKYKYSYLKLFRTLITTSHDPLSKTLPHAGIWHAHGPISDE